MSVPIFTDKEKLTPTPLTKLLTRVRAVQFLGPFTRLSLTVPGAAGGILECDVAANAFAELGTAEGAELALGLRPEALRVFAPES